MHPTSDRNPVVPVEANKAVKGGAVLFQLDPTPYKYKVRQLEASLAQAQQQVKQLRASYDQTRANADGLKQQLEYQTQRQADGKRLTNRAYHVVMKREKFAH